MVAEIAVLKIVVDKFECKFFSVKQINIPAEWK